MPELPEVEVVRLGLDEHLVGRAVSPREHARELARWAAEHFPGATPTHTWSAQDYRGADALPSVGHLLPGSDRVVLATGYDKWGLAMSVAATRKPAASAARRQRGPGASH